MQGLEIAARAMAASGASRIVANLNGMASNELSIERTQDGAILHPDHIDKFVQSMHSAGTSVKVLGKTAEELPRVIPS